MITSIESYRKLGERAGQAMANHDSQTLREYGNDYRSRRGYELTPADKASADLAYETAYDSYRVAG